MIGEKEIIVGHPKGKHDWRKAALIDKPNYDFWMCIHCGKTSPGPTDNEHLDPTQPPAVGDAVDEPDPDPDHCSCGDPLCPDYGKGQHFDAEDGVEPPTEEPRMRAPSPKLMARIGEAENLRELEVGPREEPDGSQCETCGKFSDACVCVCAVEEAEEHPNGEFIRCPECGEDEFKVVGYTDHTKREKKLECLKCGHQF